MSDSAEEGGMVLAKGSQVCYKTSLSCGRLSKPNRGSIVMLEVRVTAPLLKDALEKDWAWIRCPEL